MEVKVARSAGFCWGVKRAVERVVQIADTTRQPVYTLGPLIHNPQTMEYLESKGIHSVEEPEQATGGGTLVYRAHGIPPQIRERVRGAARAISDATCPDVGVIAAAVKKHYRAGYHVVIFGERSHPEVIGLMGYAPDRSSVVRRTAEVEGLPDADRVCLVSQSTQTDQEFEEVAAAVLRRYPGRDVQVINTICEDTRSRQAEIVRLCGEVDAMVVVGGKNSANTQHLADLARKQGRPTYHVETEEELDPREMSRYRIVGVTAGASTPNWMIQRIVDSIEKIEARRLGFPGTLLDLLERWVVTSNLYLAIGGAAVAYLSSVVQGVGFSWKVLAFLAMTALFVYVAHTFNQVLKPEALQINEPARRSWFALNRDRIRASIAIAGFGSLILAALLGPLAFLFMVSISVAAAIYRLPMIPGPLVHRIGLRSVSDLPGSKDLVTAGAWASLIAAVPVLSLGASPGWATLAIFLLTFTLMFSRSVVMDLRDIRGDRMVGKETLPIVLGRETTKRVLLALLALTGVLLLAAVHFGLVPVADYVLLLPLLVITGALFLYHKKWVHRGSVFEVVVDGALHSAGLAAVLTLFL